MDSGIFLDHVPDDLIVRHRIFMRVKNSWVRKTLHSDSIHIRWLIRILPFGSDCLINLVVVAYSNLSSYFFTFTNSVLSMQWKRSNWVTSAYPVSIFDTKVHQRNAFELFQTLDMNQKSFAFVESAQL